MTKNEQLELADAVSLALAYGGVQVFFDPQEFLRYLTDMTDNQSREMRVLLHNCDEALLTPFFQADTMGEHDLWLAAEEAQSYLTEQRQINAETAQSITRGIARGVAQWRGLSLESDGMDGGSANVRPKKVRKGVVLRALLVCAVLAGVGALVWFGGWWPWGDAGHTGRNAATTQGEIPEGEKGIWVETSSTTMKANGDVSERSTTQYDYSGNVLYILKRKSTQDGSLETRTSTTYGDFDEFGYPAWSKEMTEFPVGTANDGLYYEYTRSYTNETDAQGHLLGKRTQEASRWWTDDGDMDKHEESKAEIVYTYQGDAIARSVKNWTADTISSTTITEYDDHGRQIHYSESYKSDSGYTHSKESRDTYTYAEDGTPLSSEGFTISEESDKGTTTTTYQRTYDANGYLASVIKTTNGETTVTEYGNECDEHGNLVRQENLTDGSVTTFTYDYVEEPSFAARNGWG